MFKVNDFVKDIKYNYPRNIYAARVTSLNVNESGHEEAKLKIYDSSTGFLENIWVDVYRLRLMNETEKANALELIVNHYESANQIDLKKYML